MARFDTGYTIRRELIEHKPVVGQIFIKGLDYPVAISVRPREPLPGVHGIVHRIGVARHIQPMPPPSLAIAWRSEQPVDQLFVSIRRGIAHKAVDIIE